jgi:mannitol/fructose-specific phosphotransferase system IIA component (Ntr-type)
LAKPVVVFGRSAEGVMFDDASAGLARLVFLIVTPAEQPAMQVHLLGRVAAMAGNPELRSGLLLAESPGDVMDILSRPKG